MSQITRLAALATLVLLVSAPPARAGRKVQTLVNITNLTDQTVRVRLSGPYLTPFESGGHVFPPTNRFDGVTVADLRPGESRMARAREEIRGGHTRHFIADVQLGGRAVGQYRWKSRMNLKGITDCELVRRRDPDYRFSALHKKTDEGFTERELAGRLGAELISRRIGPPPEGGVFTDFETLEHWMGQYLDLIGETGRSNANTAMVGAGLAAGVEAIFATSASTCLTQLWILPPEPPEARSGMDLFMNGWGDAGYSWVADFDGDGRPDIASAHGDRLFLTAATGDWSWEEQTLTPSPAARWGAAGYTFVGDFDGDGKADIASAVGRTIYLRTAAAGWGASGKPIAGHWGSAAYTWSGDFDGDGKADIASGDGGAIHVYHSTGDGFRSSTARLPGRWGSASYTRVGDFDGDGKDDIASADGGRVWLKRGTATGFEHHEWRVEGPWGSAGYTFVGDFDGDGKDDFATARGGDIRVHRSTGAGFETRVARVPANWGSAGYTWAADFDGDDKDDIASADGGRVFVNLSTGDGFRQVVWTVPSWWGSAGYTRVADFDRDGRADIVTASDHQVRVKLSRGF